MILSVLGVLTQIETAMDGYPPLFTVEGCGDTTDIVGPGPRQSGLDGP
jgi:hypothetical protein